MLQITTYPTASDFLTHTQSILAQDEVTNGLMLGLLRRMQKEPTRAPADLFLATIHHGEQLIASAMQTPPHNLLVHSTVAEPTAAFALLAQHLYEQKRTLPGVNGRKDWSLAFAENWQRLTGQSVQTAMQLRVFALTAVVYGLEAAPGQMRPAGIEDLSLAHGWILDFASEAMSQGAEQLTLAETEWRILQGQLFLWEAAGSVVAMAAKTRETPTGSTIGLVYTPPALRGRGYATAVVAHLSQQLLARGKRFVTLFTDLSNPISNHIYQRIGYRAVCDFTTYRFNS